MDLRLNATRRSINLSVYLVFDLEAGRFKFLRENLLGAGRSKMSLPVPPFTLYNVVYYSKQNPLNRTQMTSVVNLACKQEINYSHLHSQMSKIFAAKLGRSFTCGFLCDSAEI